MENSIKKSTFRVCLDFCNKIANVYFFSDTSCYQFSSFKIVY